MPKRSWKQIFTVLFFGAIIGSVLGELLGWLLPEGVVKSFFLTGVRFDLAGLFHQDSGVIILNLVVITLKFGLELIFNFTSLLGMAAAYYFLRYFR
ncbi:MAG: DUF4321 domain-containing protein [Candidatus Neomarinimicrobiota bacterium]|nr:MAG: DUF4321 domain-containing protein [Candidatus Neomarinimicrobiota bacterium]